MKDLWKYVLIITRVAVAVLCALGVWHSWRLARAGYLFDQDTAASVRSAITVVPDAWPYYLRLSQLDPLHARALLTKALALNHYDAQAYVELALQYEAEGNYDQAEKLLLSAFAVDRTYLPRWSLANFYLRRDNMPAFWYWARSAAAMPSDDISSLFELCWRVAPDPERISTNLLDDNVETLRQLIVYLLAKDQVDQAGLLSPRLVLSGNEIADRPLLFSVIDRLIASNDKAPAVALWRDLSERHWVDADLTAPNNPRFTRQPLPVGFDWALPEVNGLHSWSGVPGLETEFSGDESEDTIIAQQVLDLDPGGYTVTYSYRTTNVAADTGIHWQIIDVKSGKVLAQSADLSSEGSMQSAFQASLPPEVPFVRMSLVYHRAQGTTRIAGTLVLEWVRIEAQQK